MNKFILADERVIPKLMNPRDGMLKEHIARYEFAKNFVKGRLLDLACGVGYAVPILLADTKTALVHEYVGVDIDKKCIEYANLHYAHPNATFMLGNACDPNLSKQLGRFDSIISFETIEHIENDYDFIKNIVALLKPGGTALISTPFGRGRAIECNNPYHFRQYTETEFRELLVPFKTVSLFHQLDECIEEPLPAKKYYLMLAVCSL